MAKVNYFPLMKFSHMDCIFLHWKEEKKQSVRKWTKITPVRHCTTNQGTAKDYFSFVVIILLGLSPEVLFLALSFWYLAAFSLPTGQLILPVRIHVLKSAPCHQNTFGNVDFTKLVMCSSAGVKHASFIRSLYFYLRVK